MREIKFRAWHKELEEYLSRDGRSWHHYGPNIVDGVLRSEDCTIEQFTGLHDKNGKEIYEGDIFTAESKSSMIGEIYFSEGSFRMKYGYRYPKDNDRRDYFLSSVIEPDIIEVIGNIHENPELLEE